MVTRVDFNAQAETEFNHLADIDELLAQIWPDVSRPAVRLLVCHQTRPISKKLDAYTQYLSELLKATPSYHAPETGHGNAIKELAENTGCNQDLIIFEEPDESFLKRMLLGPAGCRVTEQLPTSVLVARQPRYPLRKILFITRGQAGVDEIAVDWLVRLAQPAQAAVTVLAVVPALPVVCQQALAYMPDGLTDWLTTDTPLGSQLRQMSRHLNHWEINGKLRFRQGPPERQIQREIAHEPYDLVILAADPHDWWARRLLGELVDPLLHWIDRPVLVARHPRPAHKR